MTAGRGISLGAESGGELGLTQGELAFISAPNLSIGNTASGPITIRGAGGIPTSYPDFAATFASLGGDIGSGATPMVPAGPGRRAG